MARAKKGFQGVRFPEVSVGVIRPRDNKEGIVHLLFDASAKGYPIRVILSRDEALKLVSDLATSLIDTAPKSTQS